MIKYFNWRFMRCSIVALTCFYCLGLVSTTQGVEVQDKPNIVFLLADDLGYGDLGCFGSPVIQSPHLDQLADQGVKLKQCYAASPNCSPSRAGILTGRSPYRVGMYDFARFKPLHIPIEETTLAEQLRTAGYQTMFAGKWHCSGDFNSGKQPYPGDHGFDHWLANATNFGKDPKTFLRNGEPAGQIKGWMSELVVNEAMTWLNNRDPGRFRPLCRPCRPFAASGAHSKRCRQSFGSGTPYPGTTDAAGRVREDDASRSMAFGDVHRPAKRTLSVFSSQTKNRNGRSTWNWRGLAGFWMLNKVAAPPVAADASAPCSSTQMRAPCSTASTNSPSG